MKKNMVISLKRLRENVAGAIRTVSDDQITVYAAQATFFIITSTIPFLLVKRTMKSSFPSFSFRK